MMLFKFAISILLATISINICAQEIAGVVIDEKKQDPMPFVNIWFKGTTVGTTSDINGYFQLQASKTDTLCFSSVGYIKKEIRIEKKWVKIPIEVMLVKDVKLLNEVQVNPEVSRAKVLFKQILEHKKENHENMKRVNKYNTFARTSVYVAIDSTSMANRFINNLDEVTMKMDDQDLKFSPIYIAELGTATKAGKDSVVYSKKDGIFPKLNQTIESLILLNVVVDLDFYKEQIDILGRGFTSPISNTASLNYNIYLNDSTVVDGNKFYSFSFAPKNKYNPLFTGGFTVESGSFALSYVYVYIRKEANINFVNGFKANVSFQKTKEGTWFYKDQEISLNLSLVLNKDTTSKYGSQRIDEIYSGNWMVTKTTYYSTSKRLNEVKASQWKNQPVFASSLIEEETYERVDNLKENSLVKFVDAFGGMVLTGYVNAGIIDFGPVYDMYSTNAIEGNRITMPIRTSEKLFKRFTVGGFVGYGTKNMGFKYGLNAAYQPLPTDKFILRMHFSDDYKLISQDKYLGFVKKNPNTKGNGNFVAALTSREHNPYLKEEKSIGFKVEYNADDNISVEVSPYYLSSKSTPEVNFINSGVNYGRYENYGMLVNFRLAFGQHYDKYYFVRVYHIDQTPVVNLSWDLGKSNLPGEGVPGFGLYSHFHGSIAGKLNMGKTFMRYMVNLGYLFGDAPYDLLDQPVGSMSLGYAKYRYNLLHHASFAHNVYTNIHLDFNGGGFLLNRIPLVKQLKLREMISLKSHYGALTGSYKPVFDLPGYYSNELTVPYVEFGVGLTNILKVMRVEYIRQLGNTYVNSGFADKNGIRVTFEMSF